MLRHEPPKMISEIANALFLTYLATEYVLVTQLDVRASWIDRLKQQRNIVVAGGVSLLNVLDRVTGAAHSLNDALSNFLHIPKIALVLLAYLGALYVDCRKVHRQLTTQRFAKAVGLAFLYVLPVYPFLAVLFSFGFFVVIVVWESLNLPDEWLNAPVYYGTLYGPISLVYWRTKKQIVQEQTTLPTTRVVKE